jgi:Flp pilus assembly protein TadG
MKSTLKEFWRADDGGPAAEFALVLPLLLIFLFGIIDVGRLMWTWNRAEKATHMGVRYAVVADIVPAGLASYSFSKDGGLIQGAIVPESSFGGATCSSATAGVVTCVCKTGATCPPLGTANVAAFQGIVGRMSLFFPELNDNRVVVEYGYSGLGYAGDPFNVDVAPLVTVSIRNVTFTPFLLQLFGSTITLPDFRASLTMEDGAGTVSN